MRALCITDEASLFETIEAISRELRQEGVLG